MNLGIDVNLIIKILLGIVALYGLILLAVTVFFGLGATGTMLRYTAKFWWVIAIIVGFIIIYVSLTSKKKNISTGIEKIKQIDRKTKEDEAELKRLEAEKKSIEDEIQKTTDHFKKKLEDLKKKEPKPGDAGKSSDALNDAWK